ncbi:glycosyltransferase family 4 protein [Candidatus Parcubacteria bacterium]|nr:glycosyltransferase family 4 protein [Candidatus Parcubacteria bacterium]
MRRILVFSLAYYPHIGGAEVALKEITNRIRDVEFHILTLNFGGDAKEEKMGNVIVHRLGNGASYLSKLLFIPRAVYAARTLHKSLHFDAFWAMMSYMLFPIAILRLVGLRVPYLLTLQEGDPWKHMFSRWFILPLRPLLSIGFENASAVSAISTYLGRWATHMGFKGKVAVIPNGVDLTRFIDASHPPFVTAGTVNLVTASRLVHKNALDDVIRAIALLPENVQFVIYGSGPDETKLRKLSEELGVSSRVLFKGHSSHAELARSFSTAHIFIRPSRSEGMGNSFIEAMAAGLPVIATQEGGIADFLFDEKRNPVKPSTGWAVDVDSPEQIALAVKDIITNQEKVARVRANGLSLVREKYDWNLVARAMKAVFDGLIESR